MTVAKIKRVKALEKQLEDTILRMKDTAYLYGEGSPDYKNALMRRGELELPIRTHEIFIAEAKKEEQERLKNGRG